LKIQFNTALKSEYAYSLYAALLESLPRDIAEKIHRENLLSHYTKASFWHVSLFDDSALPYIESKLEYPLRKHNVTLNVVNINRITFGEKEFCTKFLLNDEVKNSVTLKFQTPTAFKVNGEYANIPTPHLIMQSLLNKWNKIMPQSSLEEADILRELESSVSLKKYELKSVLYAVKNVKIPAFVGEVTLNLNGNEPFIRILNMLLAFGEFSGIGIKASLGMGGVEII
jgi:CRISPR-associated endoribonuclease Cas6